MLVQQKSFRACAGCTGINRPSYREQLSPMWSVFQTLWHNMCHTFHSWIIRSCHHIWSGGIELARPKTGCATYLDISNT
jgi:hypothetical protein